MTISRSDFVLVVRSALECLVPHQFSVDQSAIGQQASPDLRIRIKKVSGLRFSATEYHEVNKLLARIEVEHGLVQTGRRQFQKMVRIDYAIASNPSLARSETETSKAREIGETIDAALDILAFNPIIKRHTLEAMLHGKDYPLPNVDRAIAFLLSRSLATKITLNTTQLVGGVDQALATEYLVSSDARMKVSGSRAEYGLMTLLMAAMERKPEPKSKRGPKPQHKRNAAILRRDRDSAHGYRRGH